MSEIKLPAGTIEFIPVTVKDRLGGLTSLEGLTCQFRVVDDQGEEIVDWASASVSGMRILSLLDTTSLDADDYDLFVKVIVPPEEIILGPFRFTVG